MGNCCRTLSNPEIQQDYMSPKSPEFLHQPVIGSEDDDDDENDHHDQQHIETTSTVTTKSNTPFQGTPFNELSATTTTMTTMLPLVDPRLVSLLDFSRQLYVRRKDIFNKVMPVHRQDLEAIFGEMKNVQQQEKKKSRMVGMVRQRSTSFGDEKSIKLERFKVKPITDSKGVPSPADGKGGGGSKPTGSK